MKLVLAWLATLGVAIVSASSCSIEHRSGDFECTSSATCTGGRTCMGGYCVFPGGMDAPGGDGPKRDAPVMIDAAQCPAQCSSCNLGSNECVIDCAQTNCINTTLVCPSGWHCNINCSTDNSCRNGVNCAAAKSCAITCTGQGSCRQLVSGTGEFNVKCVGQGSCRGINCDAACACDVSCSDPAECSLLTCSTPACGVLGGGCTSMRAGCDTCVP